MSNTRTRRIAVLDVAVVLGLGSAYVAADLTSIPKRWLIACMVLALIGYGLAVWRRGRGRETWRDFGLRTDNLRESIRPIGIWTGVAALLIVVWAWATGGTLWKAELAILLPLYPIYGVAQQLIFQGVLHRRLLDLTRHRWLAAGITALAFGMVHLREWPLVGLTCVGGFVWSLLYQRWPNVWALGLSHGILASLAYPLVLGDNPLLRL